MYFPSSFLIVFVSKQLVKYLTDNHLLPDRQSAYRRFHSTETAVLRVLTDILSALDSGDLAMLTLLDLSAAFDSVDHDTLLKRLQKSYGLGGAVINWFTSYLAGRTQFVVPGLRQHQSCTECLQGSVLGPILFLLYTPDVLQLVKSHQLQPHAYADDTQICGSCRPSDVNILQAISPHVPISVK